jgi:hypothetical protein
MNNDKIKRLEKELWDDTDQLRAEPDDSSIPPTHH